MIGKDTAMSHKKRRHSSTWGTFGTIDPRFARVGLLGIGITVIFAALYLFIGLEIFRWLTYISIAVLIVITLVTMMMGMRRED